MFIQGKKHTEKRRNSSKDEVFKYHFKPSRVDRTNRSSSRQSAKRSTSRQKSTSKKLTRKADYDRSRDQDGLKVSPKPLVFDRLSNRAQYNTTSIEALRCSQENVKQKLLDKYFKSSLRQRQVVMQKSPVLSR